MMRFARLALFALMWAVLLSPEPRAQEPRTDKLALKAARIITVAGEDISNGVILVENGKIKDVGKDLKIPYDFWVIDAGEAVVFPGMIESHTARGLDRSNESLPVLPFLDVGDAIDPSNLTFEEALRDGITTLLVAQGNDTVIGGMSRVIKPIGRTVPEMTLKAQAGLKLSISPKRGYDRMTQMAAFRETFRELDEYLGKLAESKYEESVKEKDEKVDIPPDQAREKGMALIKEEDLDFKHLNLKRLKDGRLPAFLYCGRAMDVALGIKLAEEHGFLKRSVFVLGNECHKAADLIKKAGRPVILSYNMLYTEEDPLTGEETEVFVPSVFFEKGIPFAVTTSLSSTMGERYPWYQAARLVRNGIPRQTALESITMTPASMLGMGHRLGAILPGYDATFLVLTGDILDSRTWVDKVFIEGELVYEREKDHRLQELLLGSGEAEEEADGEEKQEEEKPGDGEKKEGEQEKGKDKAPEAPKDKSGVENPGK